MSEVAISNRALLAVGGKRILSLNDETVEAALASTYYDSSRRAVQEAYDWSFNRARVELVPDATPPEYGYDQRYLKPADALTIRQVTKDPRGVYDLERWVVEGRFILADNADTILVRYNYDEKITAAWTPMFEDALVAYLASQFALPYAESKTLQTNLLNQYAELLDQAASVDGLQGRSEQLQGGRAERARWTRGTAVGGRYGPW